MNQEHIIIGKGESIGEDECLKFVQLYIDEEPVLIADTIPSSRHSTLLDRILTEHEIDFETEKISSKKSIPCIKGDRYKAVGMGLMYLDEDIYRVPENDTSVDYKLGPNQKHFNDLKEYAQDIVFEIV